MIYRFTQFTQTLSGVILEINPVIQQIRDLQGRAEALRGYL